MERSRKCELGALFIWANNEDVPKILTAVSVVDREVASSLIHAILGNRRIS